MQDMISLEIDGKKIDVRAQTTVLEAAQKLEINIPTLCSQKSLLPYGACRLCLVEVNLKEGPVSLQTSCTYPVLQGLTVRTSTPKVIKTRKMMMELLLARCPDAEPVKKMAQEMGIEKSRVKAQNRDCLLCGLCVRMCDQRMGRGAINFVGRGQKKEVVSAFGKPSDVCQACGACDFVCPTKKIICSNSSRVKAVPIPCEFNAGLDSRPAVYIPYPQAVPNKAVIDSRYCVHLLTGQCGICKEVCEAQAIDYDQKQETIQINTGSVILTGGVALFDARLKKEYGYARYANVITSLELERILSSSGPTSGALSRPSDGATPRKVAFIQCVGSRDPSVGKEFCSSVCCMYSIKEAMIVREHSPQTESTVFYNDIRSFGKDYERYYEEAKKTYAVKFVPSLISKVYERPKSKNLIVRFMEDGAVKEEEFDMVVLAVGLSCTDDIGPFLEKSGIKANEYGFIGTDRYQGGATGREGIFAGATITEPKDIPESVIEGSAAAALASSFLKDERGDLTVKKRYPPQRNVQDQEPRIGVFVCRCGRNIASVVDVPEVVKHAAQLNDVVYATEFLYTCSQDALENMKDDIKKHDLNRVVVASCTPRTHEALFRDTVREAGLNQHLFEMTSLREQVSWVHKDHPKEATRKSKELVSMMVAKARRIKPLESVFSDVTPSALVIGGGAAGMQAALTIAEQGYEVSLVEKEEELGGHLRELFDVFEGADPRGLLDILLKKVHGHEKIRVLTGATVKNISGFIGNYKSVIEHQGGQKEISHGVVVVATGALGYQPKKGEFGYEEAADIITQVCLEERLAGNPAAFFGPKSFVMVQCVGSRNDEHPYCSRVCCAHAVKNAIRLKNLNPENEIIVFYRDIRTYGFLEKYYLKARELGVVFLRFEADNEPRVKVENGIITVTQKSRFLKDSVAFRPDFLVLSTGITPAANEGLAKILKIPLNADGFFLEAHPKIRPSDFATEGMFLCGLAHSPRFLHESLMQAQAAAMRTATILSKDKVEAKANTVCVNERLCKGCGLCVSVCPFEARELDEETRVAKVIDVLCHGCGACAVACPSGATTHKGFSKKQIMTMMEQASS